MRPACGAADRPRGWEVVRLAVDPGLVRTSADDLEALADAVREAARTPVGRTARAEGPPEGADPMEVARRGHLRVLRSPER